MNQPKIANNNEIVWVDDDSSEFVIFNHYFKKSKVKNPLKTFSSGLDFLSYLEKVKKGKEKFPALVLLDIRMPFMDGFQVLQKLRKDPFFSDTLRVIMFSNSDAASDVKRAMELGADAYQAKPLTKEGFLSFFNSLVPNSFS